MIENDIISHLKSDTTLMGLLTGNISNKYKLFLMKADDFTVPPFIVYEVNTDSGDFNTTTVETDRFQFNIFATTNTACKKIADRLIKLLSISDEFNSGGSTSIISNEYYIYSGLHTGADNYINDTETKVYILPVNFKFVYKRKIV